MPLAILVVAAAVVCTAARRWPGAWLKTFARALAVIIVVAELSWQPYLLLQGRWSPAIALPIQLCDVGGFVAAAALWWRKPLLVEIAYFWGLGGTLQALLTPDLPNQHFPGFRYLQFYVTHAAIVLAALFLVIGVRLRPRAGSVPRIFFLTLGFAAAVAFVNVVTGGNYMYLRQIPPGGSLLNYMGPWPWYILTGIVLAFATLLILDAPFRIARRQPL